MEGLSPMSGICISTLRIAALAYVAVAVSGGETHTIMNLTHSRQPRSDSKLSPPYTLIMTDK